MDKGLLTQWIEERVKRGLYCFTAEDIAMALPSIATATMRMALYRQREKGRIVSPWRNFYMIVPEEYSLNGQVPAHLYIDHLMLYLGKEYYVCLLNAAALHGSSHQAVMTFSVMTSAPAIRSGEKNGLQINFYSRKRMPMQYVVKRKAKTGFYNVSSPELTALDLVANQEHVGGLNRVAVVLGGLAEEMDAERMDQDLMGYFPVADVQRLGYILDVVLGEQDLSDAIHECMGKSFRKAALKTGKPAVGCDYDRRWRLMINETIDDEA